MFSTLRYVKIVEPARITDTQRLLNLDNGWWEKGEEGLKGARVFERPALEAIQQDVEAPPQILSATGPRRVAKTTLLRQVLRLQIREGTPRAT